MPAVGYSHLADSVSDRPQNRCHYADQIDHDSGWSGGVRLAGGSATASTKPRAFDKSEGVVQAGVHGLYTALCPTAHCWHTINLITACRWCSCWSCSACRSIVWRQFVSWGCWAVYFICKHGKTNKERHHQWKNREGPNQRSRYN